MALKLEKPTQKLSKASFAIPIDLNQLSGRRHLAPIDPASQRKFSKNLGNINDLDNMKEEKEGLH